MHILNFSHPLTPDHIESITNQTQHPVEHIRDVRVHFDASQPFVPQLIDMLDGLAISSDQWQTQTWLIVLPSLNYIAAILLAELHGRLGHFPTIVRLRPVTDALVSSFEVGEIINLDSVRNTARMQR